MSNIREEYKCAKKSKFMQAVFIGALAGAAISLFDKQTRYSVLENSKSCMGNMKEFVKNPRSVPLLKKFPKMYPSFPKRLRK